MVKSLKGKTGECLRLPGSFSWRKGAWRSIWEGTSPQSTGSSGRAVEGSCWSPPSGDQQSMRKWDEAVPGEGCLLEEWLTLHWKWLVLHWNRLHNGMWSWHQPQGSRVVRRTFLVIWETLDSPVRSREMDLIFMGPFQLELFDNSMIPLAQHGLATQEAFKYSSVQDLLTESEFGRTRKRPCNLKDLA